MSDFNKNTPYWYGLRHGSNQPKAQGFMGEVPVPGGGVATEYSMDMDLNGKQVQMPSIVPTLSPQELGRVLASASSDGAMPIPDDIAQKAADHAAYRMAMGQSPFWRMPEKQTKYPIGGLLDALTPTADMPLRGLLSER